MLIKQQVIEKIRVLPEDILNEINDFIDFLATKRKVRKGEWAWLVKDVEKIYDTDLSDYLEGLTNYENMLASGKIKWK